MFTSTKQETAEATTFIFTPQSPVDWLAGQSIKIEVPGPYGPLEHRFSISSAPYEGVIAITTRLSGSAYKNSLNNLQPGDTVKAYGLEGDFIWRDSQQPHIFIAAGIGVTPFHAMVKQRVHQQLPLTATLIYASSHDHIFKEKFETWQQAHADFTFVPIAGRRVTAADIPKDSARLIYVSGPSLMVDEFSAELLAQGVAEERLVRDWFTGRLPAEG